MMEARYYKTVGSDKTQCMLCPRGCVINQGKYGLCGVRKNIKGKLYALTYGKVSSVAVDPIEKKPLYHFYPGKSTLSIGTFGCNMLCKHCQNWEISHQKADEDGAGLQDLPPEKLIKLTKEKGCDILVWTYNEPSIWFEYILDSAKLAKKEGILTVMVTSGMINKEPLKELLPYIDAYRLDIKGFSEEFYENLTGARALHNALENALLAYDVGVHVEIITNIIPNWNDADEHFEGLSKWIVDNLSPDVPWHLTAYHPSNKLDEVPTPVKTLERGMKIGHEKGLYYIYIGNVIGHFGQDTVCPGCHRTLIERKGFQISCNHIVDGRCGYCGYKIASYQGEE